MLLLYNLHKNKYINYNFKSLVDFVAQYSHNKEKVYIYLPN